MGQEKGFVLIERGKKSVRPKNHCFGRKKSRERIKTVNFLFKSTIVCSTLSVNIEIVINTTTLGHTKGVDVSS